MAEDFFKRVKGIENRTAVGRGRRADTQWILVKLSRRGDLGVMDFESDWTDLDDVDYEKVAFRLNQHGSVEMRGIIVDGEIDDIVFILPPGFRPKKRERFICSNGVTGSAVVEVYPTGEVVVVGVN
jgi:hypothetical protein